MSQLVYNKSYISAQHPTDFDAFVDFFVRLEKPEVAILVLPTNKYVKWAKKEFCKRYFNVTNKPTPMLRFYRLQDFARICLEEATPAIKYRLLSDAAIVSLVEDAAKLEELTYFKKSNNNISVNVLQKISQIILGLKEDGITPESMIAELTQHQNIQSADIRFNEITRIYSKYNELLSAHYLDETTIYTKLIEVINKGEFALDNLSFLHKDTVVLFTGFSEFKLPESKFVALFSDVKTPTVINIDYSPVFGPNIDILPENVRRLVGEGHNQQIKLDANYKDLPSNHIKRWLYDEDVSLKYEPLLKQIKVYETTDRITEVKHIAKLVIYLNLECGIALNEMCVSMRHPQYYTDLFRELFSESGIIVNISDRFNLASATPIVLIFALLDIVLKRWRRKDIERIIYFNEIKQEFSYIDTLVKFANKYRIVGGWGVSGWNKIFNKYSEYCEHNDAIVELPRSIATFNKLKNALNFKNEYTTFKDFVDDINEKIIKGFKIKESIYRQYESIVKEQLDNESLNNFSLESYQVAEEIEKNGNALSQFMELLYEIAEIEDAKSNRNKVFFKEAVEKLKIITNSAKFQIAEKESLGINITAIEQSRGIPYKVMILCGAVDGEFPLSFKTDKFLGKELPRSEDIHNDSERILFYQFLMNNVRLLDNEEMRIYIFYPVTDNAKKLVRSSFINDLCQITTKDDNSQYITKINTDKIYQNNDITAAKWINYITQNIDILKAVISTPLDLISDNYRYIKEQIENNKNIYYRNIVTNSIDTSSINIEAKNVFKSKIKNSVYSITQLETFANCSTQYFFKYILGLKPEKESSDYTILPVDMGQYLHLILEIYYKQKLKENGAKCYDVLHCNDIVLKELYEICDKITENVNISIMKYEILRLKSVLNFWLKNEAEKHNNTWDYSSVKFEQSFSTNDNANYIILLHNNDTLKLKGRIDRIEINDETHKFIVGDYKLGASGIKNINDILSGKSLQIPIYLLAAQEILCHEYTPFNGVYYLLQSNKRKTFVTWSIPIKSKHEALSDAKISDILNMSLEYAMNYKNYIESLNFQHGSDKHQTNCKYCSYTKNCRIYEQKHIKPW